MIFTVTTETTRVGVNVNWMDAPLPAENRQAMIDQEIANLDLFKGVCEENPA